ncbi:unnamed protein product [Ranitomeya imitator]|uniref:Uncharacterized protein n=1 Tax=Ranitomeya imitator TaxID=111125 RepID=A0ABN9LJU6_9NEOB|nr:unnamed protein product [Ranitomeya imitator]
MTLTLAHLQKNLDTVNTQIVTIENQLASTLTQEEFQAIKVKNQETLQAHRQDLEKKEMSKFLRDTEDYLQNRVYQWREKTTVLQTAQLTKLLRISRQQNWLSESFHHNPFFRGLQRPVQRKTRRGGQCRRGNQDTNLERFFHNLRLKAHFQGIPVTTVSHNDPAPLQLKELGLQTPSVFMPPKSNPSIETFIALVERDIETFNREFSSHGYKEIHSNISISEVKRIVIDDNVRNQRLNEMEEKFSQRGYPKNLLAQSGHEHLQLRDLTLPNNKEVVDITKPALHMVGAFLGFSAAEEPSPCDSPPLCLDSSTESP